MVTRVQRVKEKYESLSCREQWLIVGTVFVAVLVLWFLLAGDPLQTRNQHLSADLGQLTLQVERLQRQQQRLIERRAADPNRDLKERIARLNAQLQQLDIRLAEKFHGLIEPQKMASVLESILQKNGRLKLLSVKSLASEPLITETSKTNVDAEAETVQVSSEDSQVEPVRVYRHGLEISFEGDYLSTLDYLRNLEALDWEFYWDEVRLDVEHYPRAQIVIRVHTISLKDSWIGV